MANVADVVRNFMWAVEFDGIDQFLVQKVSGIEKEYDTITYGDVGADVERPGRPKSSDVTFEKVIKATGGDNAAWEELQKIYNSGTGKYANSNEYVKNRILKMLNPDGTVARTFILTESWIKKVSMSDFERLGNDPVMETVTLSVRDIIAVKS